MHNGDEAVQTREDFKHGRQPGLYYNIWTNFLVYGVKSRKRRTFGTWVSGAYNVYVFGDVCITSQARLLGDPA